jgi:hypothetical protein
MAEKNIDQANAAIKGLEATIKSAEATADVFARKAAEAAKTGATAASKQLNTLASIYDAIAKGSKEALVIEGKLSKLYVDRISQLDKIKELEKSIESAKEEETKDLKERLALEKKSLEALGEKIRKEEAQLSITERQIKAQKGALEETKKSVGLLGKLFSSGVAQALGWILSTERLISGLKGAGRAVQDVVDISLTSGSFIGMTGNINDDFKVLADRAKDYSWSLGKAQIAMAGLGISAEETADSFKRFSQITAWSDHSAESMENLTEVTGYLASALQVSLGDATDYVVEANLKFGRTGTQSAMVLKNIRDITQSTNTELQKTVIIGRDVTKVIFDLARESQSGAQEQDLLAKMITKNMVALQAQGYSYEASLKGATTYIKKLTTEAPDWTRILSGRDLSKTIRASMAGSNITGALRDQLEAAKPGLSKQIAAIMSPSNKASEYTKQQMVQRLLQDTGVGIEAMEKSINDIVSKSGANAVQAIQQIYGITDPLVADQMVQQAKLGKQATEQANNFKNLSKEQIKLMYGMEEASAEYYKKEEHRFELKKKIEGILMEKEKKALGTSEEQIKKKREEAIEAVKKDLEIAKSKGDQSLAAHLQEKLDNLQGSEEKMKQIAEEEKKKNVARTWLTGGGLQQAITALDTNVGKISVGVAGILGLLIAKFSGGATAVGVAAAASMGLSIFDQYSRNKQIEEYSAKKDIEDQNYLERLKKAKTPEDRAYEKARHEKMVAPLLEQINKLRSASEKNLLENSVENISDSVNLASSKTIDQIFPVESKKTILVPKVPTAYSGEIAATPVAQAPMPMSAASPTAVPGAVTNAAAPPIYVNGQIVGTSQTQKLVLDIGTAATQQFNTNNRLGVGAR